MSLASANLKTKPATILCLNGGSSSIKFAVYAQDSLTVPLLQGAVKNIGVNTRFEYSDNGADVHTNLHLKAENPELAIHFLIGWLARQSNVGEIIYIGHRIVQGLEHTGPVRIDASLMGRLRLVESYAPDHLPREIRLIDACEKAFPSAQQIACFDTSFHQAMPQLARYLPLPERYYNKGVRRYGFHGISYEYLLQELNDREQSSVARHHVIMAHLGNGSSLVALKDGIPMDTTMSFTPTSGVMMGSRTGDLDPGLITYLLQNEGLTKEQFSHLVNHESGLKGISGISGDVLELLVHEKKSSQATLAIDLYCYHIRKAIGSLSAVLGGLDTIIFSGGIGENSPVIRRRICGGLQYLGIELDEERNIHNKDMISTRFRNVNVRVIRTNEELMIARSVLAVVQKEPVNANQLCNA
ncbi:MAG: acetate/propionate family kinase [Cyclobacteriaceae bacterium]|nr:acetate/propionate family kinase [Cyclobacteriaceae bacterium]